MNRLTLCNINKISQNRFILVDEEGIYYLWYISFSDYGATLEIITFKNENGNFVEIETKVDKVAELIKYLKFRLLDKSANEIIKFFRDISVSRFNIPKNIKDKFGENFCNFF